MAQVSSPAKAAAVQRAAISGGRCPIDGLELNQYFSNILLNSLSVHFRLALTSCEKKKKTHSKSFCERCVGQTVGAVMVRAAASQCLLLWRHLLHAQVST